ncbi:hypothetical protein [Brevibacterium litoralis]|uniref:hypothetical protein n=1 Tax=Brevibacterium litoralis TaxID=3138935 RepID=UPI0032EF05E9
MAAAPHPDPNRSDPPHWVEYPLDRRGLLARAVVHTCTGAVLGLVLLLPAFLSRGVTAELFDQSEGVGAGAEGITGLALGLFDAVFFGTGSTGPIAAVFLGFVILVAVWPLASSALDGATFRALLRATQPIPVPPSTGPSADEAPAARTAVPAPFQIRRVARDHPNATFTMLLMFAVLIGFFGLTFLVYGLLEGFTSALFLGVPLCLVTLGFIALAVRSRRRVTLPRREARRVLAAHWTTADEQAAWDRVRAFADRAASEGQAPEAGSAAGGTDGAPSLPVARAGRVLGHLAGWTLVAVYVALTLASAGNGTTAQVSGAIVLLGPAVYLILTALGMWSKARTADRVRVEISTWLDWSGAPVPPIEARRAIGREPEVPALTAYLAGLGAAVIVTGLGRLLTPVVVDSGIVPVTGEPGSPAVALVGVVLVVLGLGCVGLAFRHAYRRADVGRDLRNRVFLRWPTAPPVERRSTGAHTSVREDVEATVGPALTP